MEFKSFRLNYILRIIFLVFLTSLFIYAIFNVHPFLLSFLVLILIIQQINSLYRYIDRTNRIFINFLNSIRYEDYTVNYSGLPQGKSLDELKQAFSEVINKLKKTRFEKEEHFQKLQTIIRHISIGLISYDAEGNIDLVNPAAKRLLNLNRMKHMGDVKLKSTILYEKFMNISPGKVEVIKTGINDQMMHFSIYGTEFILERKKQFLVSIQNISRELEEREIEAWQKLIRVLMHEIMNSIAPITSLASSALDLVDHKKHSEIDIEAITDVYNSLETIENRGNRLMNFVDSYRKLTHVPKPIFNEINVSELFNRICSLLKSEFEILHIQIETAISPENLKLIADQDLIEQVLINLIKNAREAVVDVETPVVRLEAGINLKSRVEIKVIDNGPGISPEDQDRIFIPFFSTKEEGSGIGLSLSQQIMRLHRGSISVNSIPGEKTELRLEF